MTDRIMVDRTINVGTEKRPNWRPLRYMVSGENLQDRFPEASACEAAMKIVKTMLGGKRR